MAEDALVYDPEEVGFPLGHPAVEDGTSLLGRK